MLSIETTEQGLETLTMRVITVTDGRASAPELIVAKAALPTVAAGLSEIHKDIQTEVVYVSGTIEEPTLKRKIIDVLEGTRPTFDKRDDKYHA